MEPSNSLGLGLKPRSFLHKSLDPGQPPSLVTWGIRASSVPAWRRCAPSVSAWIAELPPSQPGADQLQPSQPGTADLPPSQSGDAKLRLSRPGAAETPCSLGLTLELLSFLSSSLQSRDSSAPWILELRRPPRAASFFVCQKPTRSLYLSLRSSSPMSQPGAAEFPHSRPREAVLLRSQPGAAKLTPQPGVAEFTPPQPGAAKLPLFSGFWNGV